MRRLLLLFGLMLGLALPAVAQGGESYLLTQTNNLRASRGLPPYTMDGSLSAAARNQARWMADTNLVNHEQSDGTGPRTRALNAGFPTNWVSENIYLGPSPGPESAWIFWLNSPVHFAGLVSPYYDRVGIGSATGPTRTAFVLVFGNSTGRLLQTGSVNASTGGASAVGGPPAYVVGVDEVGNIKHEVQPGHTIGDIALFYGYTWENIPAMLELNGMTWDDIRSLQPGSVFLVPPKAGTFTPTGAPSPSAEATATASPASRKMTRTKTHAATPSPTPVVTRSIRIGAVPSNIVTPTPVLAPSGREEASSLYPLLLLGMAIVVQVGIIAGASIVFLRRVQ